MSLRVLCLCACLLSFILGNMPAYARDSSQPRIAIVIDDLGHHPDHFAFTELELPLTLAIMPFTPRAEALAQAVVAPQHEVIIHMPMQRENHDIQQQGVLDRFDSKAQFIATLSAAISRLPQAIGLNNHQGSALTARPEQMQWLMQELKKHQLYFLDSRTSKRTVAEQHAEVAGVATSRRHVFLDNEPQREAILMAWQRLLELANSQGYAIAIGHPYPATLAFLKDDLPQLAAAHNVQLVKASELLH